MLNEHDDIPVTLSEKLKAERLFLVSNMRKHGGSFVVALSEAFLRADAHNYDRLKAAFPEIYTKYSNIKENDDGTDVDHDNGSE